MSKAMHVTLVNESEGYRIHSYSEGDLPETGLFRHLTREFGRCVSKMYRSYSDRGDEAVGWVFQKRVEYDRINWRDPVETYLQEAWVEVFDQLPRTIL